MLLLNYNFKMSAQMGQYVDGACTIVDAHDTLQAAVGNATWLNEYFPIVEGPKKRHYRSTLLAVLQPTVLLYNRWWVCYIYIGGKLASRPELITIYIAYHPQKLSRNFCFVTNFPYSCFFFR